MTDKLLTRRQILSIFGGATGAAIVGTTQADLGSDEQGNLYGGTANMAGLYQVGPGLWKGPLSVRGEVPAEDGNDFIQTDAGDDGNLYAIHHYNGGWDKQGLSTTSLETDEVRTDELETPARDADYNIWQSDGGTVYANGDGSSAMPSFSGGTINDVLGDVLNNLPADRECDAVVSFTGDFEVVDETVIPDSFTHLDLRGSRLYAGSDMPGGSWFLKVADGGKQGITIEGGTLDGRIDASETANVNGFRSNADDVNNQEDNQTLRLQIKNCNRAHDNFTRRWYTERLHVHNCNNAIFCGGTDQNYYYCLAYNNSAPGFEGVNNWVHLFHPITEENTVGIDLNGNGRNVVIEGGYTEYNHDTGIEINHEGDRPSFVKIKNHAIIANENIGVDVQNGEGVTISDCHFHEDSVQTTTINVQSAATDTVIRNIQDEHDTGYSDNGTRTRINGTIEMSSAPDGTNYGPEDAGLDILDTSASPPDRYTVLRDGSVAGPL